MSGWLPSAFDNIASMITCSVLRCPETPTSTFTLIPGSGPEAPVCARHKTALENGARWMLHGAIGVEELRSGTTNFPDLRILMGQDLPHEHLVGFGISQTIGDEPGFAVELNIETADGRRQVSFWTAQNVGNRLGSFLANPPKP